MLLDTASDSGSGGGGDGPPPPIVISISPPAKELIAALDEATRTEILDWLAKSGAVLDALAKAEHKIVPSANIVVPPPRTPHDPALRGFLLGLTDGERKQLRSSIVGS